MLEPNASGNRKLLIKQFQGTSIFDSFYYEINSNGGKCGSQGESILQLYQVYYNPA